MVGPSTGVGSGYQRFNEAERVGWKRLLFQVSEVQPAFRKTTKFRPSVVIDDTYRQHTQRNEEVNHARENC